MIISIKQNLSVKRATSEQDRREALLVLQATYREEKRWVNDEEKVFPINDLTEKNVSWFIVKVGAEPVGVLRVLYDPPLDLYREYEFKSIDKNVDVDAFIKTHRIAEIGRFAVLPTHRKYAIVVAKLIGTASKETISLGFSHYITDIFEGEQHSPYQFHTRVMGFQPIATHDHGELNCPNRRITMVLDLASAYLRLRKTQGWLFRMLTEDWEPALHQKLVDTEAGSSIPADS